jgi:hypothetical protein
VILAQEATIAAEDAYAEVVCAVAVAAQEVATAWERATTLIKDVEARAILAEREAHERLLKAEAESTTVLASAHGETDGFARNAALLEGELEEAHQAQDKAEANFQGLSN